MEEICGGLIPASSNDNSEDNYHPLMMMKNINNGEDKEEEEDQYYFYPWQQTSSCISSILMSAATASHDDHEKSGSIFSLQLEGGADDDHESRSSSGSNSSSGGGGDVIIKAKISAHPLYPKLLEAYINFHKVGAPPEMANQLDKIVQENASRKSTTVSSYCLGEDPELDEFMETYCGVLAKYKLDLEKPYNEANAFLSNMESQLTSLCNNKEKAAITLGDEDGGVCYNDDTSSGGRETEEQQCLGRSEANEIKEKLLRKYGGYISTLRHEYFSRKKTNAKLPSDATHILQNWWSIHYNWPYPTEADKIALAEATGLDQKQINNWFINQRKRHWKTSSDHNFMKPYFSGLFYPQ